MMRFLSIALLAITAGAADFSRMGSVYGDARLAGLRDFGTITNYLVEARLPYDCTAFTLSAWVRRVNVITNAQITTQEFWCPDPIQSYNPDLLNGIGGFVTPTNLTAAGGAITVANFTWQPYTDTTASNIWPRGVYTIAGWSSNAVTVTLGGADISVGPGEFNRNAIPGPSASVIISGNGPCSIGISRAWAHRFFGNVDQFMNQSGMAILSSSGQITNELSLVVWRLSIGQAAQIMRTDVIRENFSDRTFVASTNGLPMSSPVLSARGVYRFGLSGIGADKGIRAEWFDVRLLPWWISESELIRIHDNSIDEINRRGIPRWK